MKKMKTLMVLSMMLMPSLTWAQDCCQKKDVKKCCDKQEVKSCCQMENAVIQTIMNRQSIRKYKDTPVEHEKLALIAKCGVHAPNGMNKQPWAVRVVESQDFIKGTTEIFKKANPEMVKRDPNFKNMYRNAPNIIVVATPKNSGMVDAGLLGENIMLAAWAKGIGSCCLGSSARWILDSPSAKPYLDRMAFSKGYELLYCIALGYPDEKPEAKPRRDDMIRFME